MIRRTLCILLVLLSGCFREVDLNPIGDDITTDATADIAADTDGDTDDAADDAADDALADSGDVPSDAPDDADDTSDDALTPDTAPDADADMDADVSDDADTEPDVPVCEPEQELCDGVDNDCDGDIDEQSATRSDANNCGECGNVCELPNAVARCKDGACTVLRCVGPWIDCDGDPSNGCETSSDAEDTCAACAEVGVVTGEPCGTCDTGVWACLEDGRISCEGDLQEDALNVCGTCDEVDPGIVLGENCGTCDTGTWQCSSVDSQPYCVGDLQANALNECGECRTIESCNAGDIAQFDACGTCGLMISECDTETCRFGEATCVEQFVCESGEAQTETEACGPCGQGTRERTRTCSADRCGWSEWTEWTECAGAGCEPGEVSTSRCSACQQSVCTSTCEWARCGFQEDAECVTGQTQGCIGGLGCKRCSACSWGSCVIGC